MSLGSVPSDLHLSAETGWRVPYLYTARLSASSWAWGSMGALGTGVLAVAEGAEMWTGWALEGGWVVAVICREKKEEGRLDGMRGLPWSVLCTWKRECGQESCTYTVHLLQQAVMQSSHLFK